MKLKTMIPTFMIGAGALVGLAGLNSCSVKTNPTEDQKMNLDSVVTENILFRHGVKFDPSRSYAEAKIMRDSILKNNYQEAKSIEEAIEKDDSVDLARKCEYIGIPVPKKPAANATQTEKDAYYLNVLKIYFEACAKQESQNSQKMDSLYNKLLETFDSGKLARLKEDCELLGIPAPKKPADDATQEEKDIYELQTLKIAIEAHCVRQSQLY